MHSAQLPSTTQITTQSIPKQSTQRSLQKPFQTHTLTPHTHTIESNQLSRLTSQYTNKSSSSRKTKLPQNPQYSPWSFLQARRQSQLNSMYNIRKNKLDEITKNNYMIYERINQQQSYYNITTMTNSNNSNNHPSQNYSHRSSAHTFLKNTCQYSKFYTIEQRERQAQNQNQNQNCYNGTIIENMSRNRNINRKILGPISNFKPLKLVDPNKIDGVGSRSRVNTEECQYQYQYEISNKIKSKQILEPIKKIQAKLQIKQGQSINDKLKDDKVKNKVKINSYKENQCVGQSRQGKQQEQYEEEREEYKKFNCTTQHTNMRNRIQSSNSTETKFKLNINNKVQPKKQTNLNKNIIDLKRQIPSQSQSKVKLKKLCKQNFKQKQRQKQKQGDNQSSILFEFY